VCVFKPTTMRPLRYVLTVCMYVFTYVCMYVYLTHSVTEDGNGYGNVK